MSLRATCSSPSTELLLQLPCFALPAKRVDGPTRRQDLAGGPECCCGSQELVLVWEKIAWSVNVVKVSTSSSASSFPFLCFLRGPVQQCSPCPPASPSVCGPSRSLLPPPLSTCVSGSIAHIPDIPPASMGHIHPRLPVFGLPRCY